jgi:hypothetical protein
MRGDYKIGITDILAARGYICNTSEDVETNPSDFRDDCMVKIWEVSRGKKDRGRRRRRGGGEGGGEGRGGEGEGGGRGGGEGGREEGE